jgi:hypothetical protein
MYVSRISRCKIYSFRYCSRFHATAVILGTYKVCLKSNATAVINFILTIELKINTIPFKIVPLGSRTPPETLFPLPLAVLELFMLKCSQLACHDLLDVVHSSKMTALMWTLSFGKRKRPHGLWSGEYEGFGTTRIPFLVKTSFMEMAVWLGAYPWCSIQVSACPIPRSKFRERFGDSNSTHYRSFWQSKSIRLQESPHVVHIFRRFLSARSYRTRFIFHDLMAI